MADANTVAIGAYLNDDYGDAAGHVRVYMWNGRAWVKKGQDINGRVAGEMLGLGVYMPDAHTVATGSSVHAGFVRIFKWNSSAWIQKGHDIKGEGAKDGFGIIMRMPDSNTIAIGAPRNVENGVDVGHVRVFIWNDMAWVQKGFDINGKNAGESFGSSVSMPDASTLAIGAPFSKGQGLVGAGCVRVYIWENGSWIQRGSDIEGDGEITKTGQSVSMPNSHIVAIGAPFHSGNINRAGLVRVFSWNGIDWNQICRDIYGGGGFIEAGHIVDMPDANTIAIGAPDYYSYGKRPGNVRVFNLHSDDIVNSSFTDYFTISSDSTDGLLYLNFETIQDELNVSLCYPNGTLVDYTTYKNISKISYEIKAYSGFYLLKIANTKHEATVKVLKKLDGSSRQVLNFPE